MGRKKSKKTLSEFHKKHPLEYEDLKAGDEVVYVRLSDGKKSVGIIKYFHLGKTICATLIDLELSNFQTAILDDITRDVDPKVKRDMLMKITNKKPRRSKK